MPDLKIKSIYRYPVKSMSGELMTSVRLTRDGISGDRYWAIYNLEAKELQGARRLPGLLQLKAEYIEETGLNDSGSIRITFPDGSIVETDKESSFERLNSFLGVKVKVCPRQPASNLLHYKRAVTSNDSEIRKELGLSPEEKTPDFANLPLATLAQLKYFTSPPGHYFDAFPLHIITQGALEFMQAQTRNENFVVERFRPNIVIENNNSAEIEEFTWCGLKAQSNETEIKIEAETVRCSVPSREQPNIVADKEISKAIAKINDRFLGVYATVLKEGIINIHDRFIVESKNSNELLDSINDITNDIKKGIIKYLS